MSGEAPILRPKHQQTLVEFYADFCEQCDTELGYLADGTRHSQYFCHNCDALLIHPWWKRAANRILLWARSVI